MPYMIFQDPDDKVNGNLCVLDQGALKIYSKINGIRRLTQILTRIEVGIASLGSTTFIPGYFKGTPKILLAPKDVKTFEGDYFKADQKLDLSYTLANPSAGKYSITPTAKLSGAKTVNESVSFSYSDSDSFHLTTYGWSNVTCDLVSPAKWIWGDTLNYAYSFKADLHLEYYEYQKTTKIYLEYADPGGSIQSSLVETHQSYGIEGTISRNRTFNFPSNKLRWWRLRNHATYDGSRNSTRDSSDNKARIFTVGNYSYSGNINFNYTLPGSVFYLAIGE